MISRRHSLLAIGTAALAALVALSTLLPFVSTATAGPWRQLGPQAWTLDGMAQVRRTQSPGSAVDVAVSAARGEVEPFQIAIHAPEPLTGVDVTLSDLTGPGVIRADRLVRYREGYVHLRRHSPDWSGPVIERRWFTDPLIPFIDPVTGLPPDPAAAVPAAPFDVPVGQTQPVWIDVHVPRHAAAGDYHGTWEVSSDQGTVSGTVSLTVWDFTLPRRPRAGSLFLITRSENRRPRVDRLLLDYRIQPDPVRPWAQPDLVGDGLRWSDLGFWSGAQIDNCTMDPPPSRADVRRRAARQDPRLRLFNYTADEIGRCPGLRDRIKAYARRLHAGHVKQLITMPPRRGLFDAGDGHPAVDIWVMLPEQLRALDPALIRRARRTGSLLWTYQALVQGRNTPSWEIDFPSTNFRILPGFLNAHQRFTGVLYWAVDYWKPNPWEDVVYTHSGCCYPGEGSLLYPGGRAGISRPVPTTRLAWIREGLEDYEYVEMLRRLGHGGQAAAITTPAASSWRRFTRDPTVVFDVRAQLAAAILAAQRSR